MASILLIEDDDLLREALASVLATRGYTVTQASDGEKGIKLFRTAPTDLVITDIVMPNKEGVETITELHRDYPNLGIIAMTGHLADDGPLYLKMAGALGARCMLEKPFDFPTLLSAIDRVLAEIGKGKKVM